MSKYLVRWKNHADLLEWKEVADEKQKFYYQYLGKRKWEMYDLRDKCYMKLKIGYALFGPPIDMNEKEIDNAYQQPEQKQKINYIMSALKRNNTSNVYNIGIIFLIANINNKYCEFPVFRLLKKRDENGKESCVFVDSVGYTYKTWERFLNTNVMPNCVYCYPTEGYYNWKDSGQLDLEYSYSPQSYSVLSSGIGAIGGAVTNVLPGMSGVIAIPCESVIRGVSEETSNYWITATATQHSANLYAIHSTREIVASFAKLDNVSSFIVKILEMGPLKANWFAVFNTIPQIVRNSNRITNFHISQLFASILFFCHVVLSRDILKEVLKDVFYDVSKNVKVKLNYNQMLLLFDAKEKIGKPGNEELFRLIKHFSDKSALYKEVIDKPLTVSKNINKNHTLENLLEVLKCLSIEGSEEDLMRNYYLFVEQVCKTCKDCSKKLQQEEHIYNEISIGANDN